MNASFRCTALGLLLAVLALGVVPSALAQDDGLRYDTTTVETLEGTVARVDTMQATGSDARLALHLDTGTETLAVHVGPLAYLSEHNFSVATGDALQIRGSRIMDGDVPALVAATIQHGDMQWTLRDDQGHPKWRGAMPPNR